MTETDSPGSVLMEMSHLLSERAKSLAEGKGKSRAESKRRAGPVIVSEEESDQDGK